MIESKDELFKEMFLSSENPVGLCVVMLLAWIATSDGHMADEEFNVLKVIAENHSTEHELMLAIDQARAGNLENIQLACETLQLLPAEQQKLFLQMAIGIAVEDGYLAVAENHILRLLTDIFHIPFEQLDRMFTEMTGKKFPDPGDPGSLHWWHQREAGSQGRSRTSQETRSKGTSQPTEDDPVKVKAYAVLGLEIGSPQDVIQETYRRLAKIHHPDRFASLGQEAVEAATVTFQRIQAAYEVLKS